METIKKPIIYLLVILPVLVGGGFTLVLAAMLMFAYTKGISPSDIPDLNGFFISLPVILLWIPYSLVLSNFIMYIIPPMRRIAENYAKESGRADFRNSQLRLGKFSLYWSIPWVVLIVLGFYL